MYVWPTVCAAVMCAAFLDGCLLWFCLFPVLLVNLESVNVAVRHVLCANLCFEKTSHPI
jgi:hypothetical protein